MHTLHFCPAATLSFISLVFCPERNYPRSPSGTTACAGLVFSFLPTSFSLLIPGMWICNSCFLLSVLLLSFSNHQPTTSGLRNWHAEALFGASVPLSSRMTSANRLVPGSPSALRQIQHIQLPPSSSIFSRLTAHVTIVNAPAFTVNSAKRVVSLAGVWSYARQPRFGHQSADTRGCARKAIR